MPLSAKSTSARALAVFTICERRDSAIAARGRPMSTRVSSRETSRVPPARRTLSAYLFAIPNRPTTQRLDRGQALASRGKTRSRWSELHLGAEQNGLRFLQNLQRAAQLITAETPHPEATRA